jgi:hypothetical protein
VIRQDIDIDGYWKVIVVYNVELGGFNTGFTQTDFSKKQSIVGISNVTNKSQLINTIVHEAKHVQSHICRYYNIDEDSEQAAYLIGYIVQKMYLKFKELL